MSGKPKESGLGGKKQKPVRSALFDDSPAKGVKAKSIATEQRLAAEVGFLLTPSSGALPVARFKADGHGGGRRFEVKETDKNSITLSAPVVGKLIAECKAYGDTPVFLLVVRGFSAPIPQDWALIPKSFLIQLLEHQDE